MAGCAEDIFIAGKNGDVFAVVSYSHLNSS
jgi:hypothetical protein